MLFLFQQVLLPKPDLHRFTTLTVCFNINRDLFTNVLILQCKRDCFTMY